MPLALCNPKSIGKEEPVTIEIVEQRRVGENYYLRYNQRHEWFWVSDMQPSEVMTFATWDSEKPKEGGTANCETVV
jgi:hypothetical protein